tara:strand:- start:153 stop:1046 length:894 start_codon:yes stop_codon:yes gene_type:complete
MKTHEKKHEKKHEKHIKEKENILLLYIMVLYLCDCCNYCSKLKGDYNRHLKTMKHKHKIEQTLPNKNNDEIVYTKYTQSIHKVYTNVQTECINCEFCDKNFKSKQSMYRHKRLYCNIKKENYDNIKDLKTMIHKQSSHINKLIDKVGTTNITNNTNTNNIIQLNNYGKEDLSHITDSMKTNLLKGPYNMIPKLIEQVHFNNDKPENQNIILPNKKENKLKIFTGDKWIYKNKDEVLNDLVDGKYFILDTHYENINKEELSKFNKNIYEKFRNIYDEKNIKLQLQVKKECELMLLNNR